MPDDMLKPGDIVFLTKAFDTYMHDKHKTLTICFINRLAKLEEIIDWGSDKGKKIKEARVQSGKWTGLPLDDCKYIFSIYYHDVTGRDGKSGVIERGVPLFDKHPTTQESFFSRIPEWLFKELAKQCERFEIEIKNNSLK
jgi:hypothetical protein